MIASAAVTQLLRRLLSPPASLAVVRAWDPSSRAGSRFGVVMAEVEYELIDLTLSV
jgi:hypothetical protein